MIVHFIYNNLDKRQIKLQSRDRAVRNIVRILTIPAFLTKSQFSYENALYFNSFLLVTYGYKNAMVSINLFIFIAAVA